METVTVTLPSETYRLLEEQARKSGKKPPQVLMELLEDSLRKNSEPSKTTRSVANTLKNSGRLRTLSPYLQNKIIPTVTLKDVQASLQKVGGKSLSDIIIEQRGRRDHE